MSFSFFKKGITLFYIIMMTLKQIDNHKISVQCIKSIGNMNSIFMKEFLYED